MPCKGYPEAEKKVSRVDWVLLRKEDVMDSDQESDPDAKLYSSSAGLSASVPAEKSVTVFIFHCPPSRTIAT
jgi:hypothetical protein